MTDSPNTETAGDGSGPFTEYAQKTAQTPGSAKQAWVVAGFLGLAAVAMALLWATALGKTRALQARLDEANARVATTAAKSDQQQKQIDALDTQVADLQRDKEQVGQTAKSLEDEMRSDLESKDVTISKLQGKLTVNILDRVMFDSGEAVLKPDGAAVLRKVAAILAGHPEIKIHVIGHTDNVPIRSRYASNWELSTARALAAVHFFTEKAGVDPRRVGAVGYGEYRPIADNATPEGRAKNRRIAITILPDELAVADTAAPVTAHPALPPADVPPTAPVAK